MIELDEIRAKSEEFGIHTSNVQRDYVFGWLIAGLFEESPLAGEIALKGGNALRKGYFPTTRYSDDLDFTTEQSLEHLDLVEQFNQVCRFAQARSGVRFDLDRNRLVDVQQVEQDRRAYKLRLYFHDFADQPGEITLKVRVDVTENDRLLLPVQERRLIHQYSDAAECNAVIRCVKLEEALADKMRCLLQRRHAFDLFDLVYGVFVSDELAVDRSEIAQTFLRKTIYEGSPAAARELLLDMPLDLMRGFWSKVVAPKASLFSFDRALELLHGGLDSIFGPAPPGRFATAAYFPARWREPILRAGGDLTLLRLRYAGVERLVEPYSLVFKRRKDGLAREYFYVWDRTGGRRGPGIKALVQERIESIENTEEAFEPRYEVELSKAGDRSAMGHFARPFGRRGGRRRTTRRSITSDRQYKVQCAYCGKQFSRKTSSTKINKHVDKYGNPCFGRSGFRVF